MSCCVCFLRLSVVLPNKLEWIFNAEHLFWSMFRDHIKQLPSSISVGLEIQVRVSRLSPFLLSASYQLLFGISWVIESLTSYNEQEQSNNKTRSIIIIIFTRSHSQSKCHPQKQAPPSQPNLRQISLTNPTSTRLSNGSPISAILVLEFSRIHKNIHKKMARIKFVPFLIVISSFPIM
jgi:hypothetical protein